MLEIVPTFRILRCLFSLLGQILGLYLLPFGCQMLEGEKKLECLQELDTNTDPTKQTQKKTPTIIHTHKHTQTNAHTRRHTQTHANTHKHICPTNENNQHRIKKKKKLPSNENKQHRIRKFWNILQHVISFPKQISHVKCHHFFFLFYLVDIWESNKVFFFIIKCSVADFISS